MNRVVIGFSVMGWTHLKVSASTRIKDKLYEYKAKGFTINIHRKTATNGNLTYQFFDGENIEKYRGYVFSDVIGDFRDDHLTRVRIDKKIK